MRPFLLAIVAVTALSPAAVRAADAAKLLPDDTKVIVTLNLRRILSDHRNNDTVQRYLEQFRLALKGSEQQLKDYYQQLELDKSEGIAEAEFLARARLIKSISAAFGMDPLEDLDQFTLGWRPAAANEQNGFVLIAEGRFRQEKFKTAIEKIGRDHFGSVKLSPPGNVWKVPDDAGGRYVTLLDARTVAVADDRKTMDGVLARAAGKSGNGLSKGIRTLLESVRKEQVGLVAADVDVTLTELVRMLRNEVAGAIDEKDAIGKFIVTQGADWLHKYASEIAAASLGLSVREEDLRLQFGLDAKKVEIAKDLQAQIQRGNFWGALALKTAFKNDIAQQLADILVRQRVIFKETTLTTHAEVPSEFIKLVLSKDLAADAIPPVVMDALSTRVTSIPLWTLPRAAGKSALEVLQVRDVVYKSGAADPIRHRLDMCLPKNKQDFPVLVLVHGGAWVMGDNRLCGLFSSVGEFLAGQGIGVVMPNYRLTPGVKHPEHARDVAQAVAWTRANIAKHGGDPKRLYLAGHSAGGHLAALLAADGSYLREAGMSPADLKGVIAISGVYKVPPGMTLFSLGGSGPRAMRVEQMLPLRGDSDPPLPFQLPGIPAQLNMTAPVFGNAPRDCAQASPLTHVHKGMPPLLVLAAEHDLPTLLDQAKEFHRALQKHGCDARLLMLAKRNHNSLIFSAIHPDDPAAQAILQFIRQ